MKRTILCLLVLFAGTMAFGQTKAKPAAPKKKPAAPVAAPKMVLKTLADSASYALGANIAQNIKKDMGDLKSDLLLQGMKDALNNKTILLDENTIFSTLSAYSAKVQEDKSKGVLEEGIAFLAKNKNKPGVKTTASGLQYEVIKEGTGVKPTPNDSVTVHYRGSLLNGEEFDASYNRNEPLTLMLGQVIKGWTEGLQLMTTGSKYKFYIPQEMGYGLHGAPPTIPGGSVLIFEVELLDVRSGQK